MHFLGEGNFLTTALTAAKCFKLRSNVVVGWTKGLKTQHQPVTGNQLTYCVRLHLKRHQPAAAATDEGG